MRTLHAAGHRLVTLTNGSAATATALLARARVAELFTAMLSVDEPRVWKPGRAAYAYAAKVCDVAPAEMMLVAVHPWDIDGAARAGLSTAWVNRGSAVYPATSRRRRRSFTGWTSWPRCWMTRQRAVAAGPGKDERGTPGSRCWTHD